MIAGNSGKILVTGVLAFVVMVAVLVVMAAGGISRTRDLLSSQEFVERTQSVLHEIEGVEDGMQDAREAALHYVLTPEKEDLLAFDEAVRQTWIRLDRIAGLTRNDKGYAEKIEQLRSDIRAELRQLSDNMRTTHTLLIFHSPQGDANRNRVRDAIQKLQDDEEALLSQRNQAAQARARAMARSLFPLAGIAVLGAVLFILVILESTQLRASEQKTRAAATLQLERTAATAGGEGKQV